MLEQLQKHRKADFLFKENRLFHGSVYYSRLLNKDFLMELEKVYIYDRISEENNAG